MIESSGIAKRPDVFPKARSSDQSQPTSSEHVNYYAARPEIGRCKYMSQKTIAFWAMLGSLDTFSTTESQVEFVCFLFPLKSLVLRENDDRLT